MTPAPERTRALGLRVTAAEDAAIRAEAAAAGVSITRLLVDRALGADSAASGLQVRVGRLERELEALRDRVDHAPAAGRGGVPSLEALELLRELVAEWSASADPPAAVVRARELLENG